MTRLITTVSVYRCLGCCAAVGWPHTSFGPQVTPGSTEGLSKCQAFKDYLDACSLFFFSFNLAGPGLSCGMWNLVPQPGIEPRPPALGVRSPSHWNTQRSPSAHFQEDMFITKKMMMMMMEKAYLDGRAYCRPSNTLPFSILHWPRN